MSTDDGRLPDLAGGTRGPPPPEARATPNLFDILRTLVRRASDGQLVLSVVAGLLGIVALALIRRWPWAAVAAFGLLLGAGAWGVLDRTRQGPVILGRTVPEPLIAAARVSTGLVALLALLSLALGAFGRCLGTWIS